MRRRAHNPTTAEPRPTIATLAGSGTADEVIRALRLPIPGPVVPVVGWAYTKLSSV